MRVINSTARTTVLRELALLRALCASLRDNRRPVRLIGKALPAATITTVEVPLPSRLPAEATERPATM